MSTRKYYITIEAFLNKPGNHISLDIKTMDDSLLTPQIIIDSIGDYLLMDPHKLFTEVLNINPKVDTNIQ